MNYTALSADDHQALKLYHWLQRRVVNDLALTQAVFDAFGLTFEHRAEALALLKRLDTIHEIQCPAPVADSDPDPTTTDP